MRTFRIPRCDERPSSGASRILRFTALALFASFVLVILPQLLTPALLNPGWQLGMINTMPGVAILPPVGACLLLLAT